MKATVEIRDNGSRSDAETADIIRAEIERIKAQEPTPPPEVLAYNRRRNAWVKELQCLRSKLRSATTKRYTVLLNLGWCYEHRGEADTKSEAESLARNLRKTVGSPR